MSHSIEEIWKEGFISENALVAPKINELYNQKSKSIVNKFEVMFKWNLIGLVIFALLVLIVLSIVGVPYLGIFISSMLMSLVIRGRKEQASFKLIDKNVSSYHYLKSFDTWMKNLIAGYAKIYSIFYPALFLSIAIQFRFTEIAQVGINGFVTEFPNTILIFSTPLSLLVTVTIITILLYFFSGALYRLDFNSLYGRMIKKLEELISDMEELRKE